MLVCPKCGADAPDDSNVCPNCGVPFATQNNTQPQYQQPQYQQPQYQQPQYPQQPPQYQQPNMQTQYYNEASTAKTLGIISLVAAILNLVGCFIVYFSAIFGLGGLVCGIIGLIKANNALRCGFASNDPMLIMNAKSAKGLNIAGLVLVPIFFIISLIVAFAALASYSSYLSMF